MRCELEFFHGAELHLLYMARRLREALAVETLLGEAEVEYFVEPGPYKGGLIFPARTYGRILLCAAGGLAAGPRDSDAPQIQALRRNGSSRRVRRFRFGVAQMLGHFFGRGVG